ncbi:MAG: hypothetical protein N4A48_01835 [Tepidibacter sp.]|jgi:hypothetical protein|uniref:hypothetical protein n=1 Tax=Tepidibacter sp. TaxID=2529387 RepID=UPI0025E7F2A9|nr:hypothetical protein [Tepidibacter sp.]MCT4507496.1 hypothetical protein [Tepidibacter sp.]
MNLVEIEKEIIRVKEKIYNIKKKELNEENGLELVTLDKALDSLIKYYVLRNIS